MSHGLGRPSRMAHFLPESRAPPTPPVTHTLNTHFDVEGLCKGLPSRVQNLVSNPEGSALFLLGMQTSIAHALPRPALEGRCGDMWGVKLKAGPEPA